MNRSIFYTVLLVLSVNDCCAQTTEFTFVDNDAQSSPQSYQYSVIQAGDNFNFKFDAGSRYFCESLFWASQPKQAAKT